MIPNAENIRWHHINDPALGLMNDIGSHIASLERQELISMPDLRRGSIIFIGSDYSGQQKNAEFESLSFLLADLERCGVWETQRGKIHQRFLQDGRRLAFKDLNDRNRMQALLPFLEAANSIPGPVVTLLIEKRVQSLFKQNGKLKFSELGLNQYSRWQSSVFERLLRTAHFANLFLAGLSSPAQDVVWITDKADIVANEAKLQEFVNIVAHISSHYLKHSLRHLKIGTTKLDTGKRDVEDLISVSDFVAGALSQVLTEYRKIGYIPSAKLTMSPLTNLPSKTKKNYKLVCRLQTAFEKISIRL